MDRKLEVGFFLPRATRVMARPEEEGLDGYGEKCREVHREHKQGCSATPETNCPISQA